MCDPFTRNLRTKLSYLISKINVIYNVGKIIFARKYIGN